MKTTKLVQASTIACSSSAMLEQHDSTRLSRLARQSRTCRVESSQVEFGPIPATIAAVQVAVVM